MGELELTSSGAGLRDEESSLELLTKAVNLGCTFWDTASIYGAGESELVIGRFFKENPGLREKVFVASKCGVVRQNDKIIVTNTKSHIETSLQNTIKRLGTTPDMYYLHRRDPTVSLGESIGTLARLRDEGKFNYIGLSECSAATLRSACQITHIDALQVEYSAWCLDLEHNDLLSTARELNVAIIAYSPLGHGLLTGTLTSPDQLKQGARAVLPRFGEENFEKNVNFVNYIRDIAGKKGCTSGQLAIAWVMKQGIIPIPGTRSVMRLEENWGAGMVELSDEEELKIRKFAESLDLTGDRYSEDLMKTVNQ
ncbi:hypothetical protein M231_06462 [Tremella mesenterica]|uniref:NADP-dependent oxidoreductase domain-containing protein n=1 Tax=Tremella mesenterica TaxID=5217 RepID=A0A4Q1BBV1_TREME|nr:hypothetical protein M231_06462 [Tremella mesenterica]